MNGCFEGIVSLFVYQYNKLLKSNMEEEEESKLRDDVIEQIKDFNRRELTEEQISVIDKLISNEDLKSRYKKFGLCEGCNQPNTGEYWCRPCNSKRFQQDFDKWTSGNDVIDEMIRKTQLNSTDYKGVIEWIEYNDLEDIEYLATGGFGTTYKANRKDGRILRWNYERNQWERYKIEEKNTVALKCLHDSQNISVKFLKEFETHILMNSSIRVVRCLGITKDPNTNNFMMVMHFARNGNLRQSLTENFASMDWSYKIISLASIALGLKEIHNAGFVHRDFHCGNILNDGKSDVSITDLGLCQPAKQEGTDDGEDQLYGVLPYVAPEVLRGKVHTQPSDVYGFGIISHEVVTGLPPYHDVAHDELLAVRICHGLRPTSSFKIPQLVLDVIHQCWDADPSRRPKADPLFDTLNKLVHDNYDTNSLFYKQVAEADEFNKTLPPSSTYVSPSTSKLLYTTHPHAIYTSKMLDFKNLPEPQNPQNPGRPYEADYSTSLIVDFTKLSTKDKNN